MKPPWKLFTTRYRPVTGDAAGGAISGAGGEDEEGADRLPSVAPVDGLGVGRLGSTAVDLGNGLGGTGVAAELGADDVVAAAGSSGNDIAGSGGAPSAYVRRSRAEPSATTSSTTMTTTPMETTIHGEEATAAPSDGRARRMPNMTLPC
ncbi:hypothetical protein [Micromonospora narathiwatensis]|uniref:hypothetical protein n=1 Tax=Micromonospora narathiwatensis TaxID=299146 RepID=UPI00142F7B0D|nr:hypothetical protein [Micromonospora narathiwatensis]